MDIAGTIDSLGLFSSLYNNNQTNDNNDSTSTQHTDLTDHDNTNIALYDTNLPYSHNSTLLQHDMSNVLQYSTIDSTVSIDGSPRITPYMYDISSYGIWTLSSSKSCNSVRELLDSDISTFWQSDGSLPHICNVSYSRSHNKLYHITAISIYLDYKLDESYTPNKITIRLAKQHHINDNIKQQYTQLYNNNNAYTYNNMLGFNSNIHNNNIHVYECGVEVQSISLEEPTGWVTIQLSSGQRIHNSLLYNDNDMNDYNDITDNNSNALGIVNDYVNTVQIVVQSTHQNGRDCHIRQIKIYGSKQSNTHALNNDLPEWTSNVFKQYSNVR